MTLLPRAAKRRQTISDRIAGGGSNVLLTAACIGIVCSLLAAGLWPFDFCPTNQVHWLGNRNGLSFGDRGIAVSARAFEKRQSYPYCTIEIWVQARHAYLRRSSTVLEFEGQSNLEGFRLQQYRDDMFVRRDFNDKGELQQPEIDIQHVFAEQPSFVTITSGPSSASVYVNGRFVDFSRRFGMNCRDLSGRLILGNSFQVYKPWEGDILGLAIYEQRLTADQVLRHYNDWTQHSAPNSLEVDHSIVYLFSEHSGQKIGSRFGAGPELLIPHRFDIPGKRMLQSPWNEFSPTYDYFEDILVNIIGFVPFGFFCCMYLSRRFQLNGTFALTVFFGGLLSLTIEVLQRFVPSRSSGMTDVVTNTLGTAAGAAVWMCVPVREWISRLFARLLLEKEK